jgi:tetrapyrrole methylase family protein/MazG family protein
VARPATVVVVGLGPSGPDHLAPAAVDAFSSVPPEARFLRTDRHPAAAAIEGASSFDRHYEDAASLADVYPAIVADLEAAAARFGRVVYAVPGSPLVAERTVELLRASTAVAVEIHPALSFLDLAWLRLGVDPLAAGVRLVDAHRFVEEAAGERGPLLVAQADSAAVLSEVKLALDPDDSRVEPLPVVVLQRLGLPDESVREVAWQELDRVPADHLTTLWLPELAAPVGRELVRFDELVRVLRDRCPWDRKQTHASLAGYLLEEAHEAIEAIDAVGEAGHEPSPAAVDGLCEELGDVLFQVVFHATLAAEEGWFTLADVARTIHDKLVRRHPHVFGTADASTAEEVVANWDAIKRAEKAGAGPAPSVFSGIPPSLPALATAAKVARRAASHGLAPPAEVPVPAVATEEDLGEILLAVAAAASDAGLDPESALRKAIHRYTARVS